MVSENAYGETLSSFFIQSKTVGLPLTIMGFFPYNKIIFEFDLSLLCFQLKCYSSDVISSKLSTCFENYKMSEVPHYECQVGL